MAALLQSYPKSRPTNLYLANQFRCHHAVAYRGGELFVGERHRGWSGGYDYCEETCGGLQ